MKQHVFFYLMILLLIINVQLSHAISEQDIKSNGTDEMIFIRGGEYTMGSDTGLPDHKPAHKVYIDSFYLDIHEVTNRQYKKFLDETDHPKSKFWHPEIDLPEEPVVGVTWEDATAYAKWAKKRLPTEAEWEYAARGGSTQSNKYPWGNEFKKGFANFGSFGIAPVKSFKPNGYGLYDMLGNVWEWCSDWYSPDYYKTTPPKNPAGPEEGKSRVLRGGAWYCITDKTTITTRYNSNPAAASYNIGFRCAKSGGKSK